MEYLDICGAHAARFARRQFSQLTPAALKIVEPQLQGRRAVSGSDGLDQSIERTFDVGELPSMLGGRKFPAMPG